MATIDDVARKAGVSKSTVSNVFSQKRPISKEVTERVLEVARRMNYKPNYWARTLANKTTRIIGLNMPGENVKFSQFHLSFLNGVLKECYTSGYRLLVNPLSNEFQSRVPNLSSEPIDGDILLDPEGHDPRITERLRQEMPFVVVGNPPKEFESAVSFVDNDNVGIAKQVTSYLLSLGHRSIVFLNAPKRTTVSADREKGYRLALAEARLPIDEKLIRYRSHSIESSLAYGENATLQFLQERPDVTAVITDTDKVALGVYRAAQQLGLSIPDRLSVFAFSDDSVFAPEFSPPLSGVRLNAEMLGREAARILIGQCTAAQSVIQRVLVPAELIFRGSCTQAAREGI